MSRSQGRKELQEGGGRHQGEASERAMEFVRRGHKKSRLEEFPWGGGDRSQETVGTGLRVGEERSNTSALLGGVVMTGKDTVESHLGRGAGTREGKCVGLEGWSGWRQWREREQIPWRKVIITYGYTYIHYNVLFIKQLCIFYKVC